MSEYEQDAHIFKDVMDMLSQVSVGFVLLATSSDGVPGKVMIASNMDTDHCENFVRQVAGSFSRIEISESHEHPPYVDTRKLH